MPDTSNSLAGFARFGGLGPENWFMIVGMLGVFGGPV